MGLIDSIMAKRGSDCHRAEDAAPIDDARTGLVATNDGFLWLSPGISPSNADRLAAIVSSVERDSRAA